VSGPAVTEFRELLREARLRAGLSQEALAEAAGLSTRAVSDLERGINRAPRPDTLEALATALRLAPSERTAWKTAWRAARDGGVRAAPPTPGNLPAPSNALVGRSEEVAALAALLEGGARLVTVTGPGGVGKTRLALAVAHGMTRQCAGGAWLVDLAPLRDPASVPAAVAHVLGVRQAGSQPILNTLIGALRERELVVVLDNCEHLLGAAPAVAALVAACPGLRVVATSRERLRLAAEREFPLGPLALSPAPLSGAGVPAVSPAVALFAERARAVSPGFVLTGDNVAAVAEVCRRLDGLPLAIELAAARVKLLPPPALLARLRERLQLLTGGARDLPARQRTMRDAIAWSHELLDGAEQALFRRLSVFVGGCTLEAVEALCDPAGERGPDTLYALGALVDKSLLQQEEQPDGEPRFRMLETIRAFAQEELEASDEAASVRRRHAACFAATAAALAPDLTGARQAESLDRLEQEHENLRRAVRLAVEERDAGLGLRLGAALWRFWWIRGHLADGRVALDALLALPERAASPDVRRALVGAGMLAYCQGDVADAERRFDEALVAARAASDETGVAYALHGLGLLAAFRGEFATAERLQEESLAGFRAAGDQWGMASALLGLGNAARVRGDSAAARALYEESLRICRATGERRGIAEALLALGHAAMSQSDYDWARRLYEESLSHQRELKDLLGMTNTLPGLGRAAAAQGDYPAARRLYEESLEVSRRLGDSHRCADSLLGIGRIAVSQGDYADAEALLTRSLAMFREQGMRRGEAEALQELGRLALAQGDVVRARELSEEGLAVVRSLGASRAVAWALVQLAGVARQMGDHDLARALLGESLPSLRQTDTKAGIGAALLNLGCIERDAGDVRLATGSFLDALANFQRVGRSRDCAICLVAAAKLLAPMEPSAAVRLSAAGAAQHERMGAVMDVPTADDHDSAVATARATLGEDAFAAAWSAGRELTLARAVSQVQALLAELQERLGGHAQRGDRAPAGLSLPRGEVALGAL
jgi:predicted ATPase/transcriptional regulator with XRE-family HTH domain